ncbi:MAG: fluoride efflux transporter CrcB [Epsilonproteobacteria bacterium]|nr:fluoride efflux transporter CrcB [Campylobacterota bacterium]
MSFTTLLAIGSGGFIGAVLRAYINALVSSKMAHNLPFGTLSVNLLGSFIMGALIAYFTYTSLPVQLKSFLSTGILGALTTYSTFAMESFLLLQGGSYMLAFANMSLNLFGTIIMAGGGYYLVNTIKG